MMTAERNQQLIALCQSLIQSRSYSGHEDDVVNRMKQAFGQWEFKVLLRDGHIVD
jgi:putative aminopeptidase FrvX